MNSKYEFTEIDNNKNKKKGFLDGIAPSSDSDLSHLSEGSNSDLAPAFFNLDIEE